MPFEKGQKKKGGRVKGTPNKNTSENRAVMQALFDNNKEFVNEWFMRTSKRQPAKALELFIKIAEYVTPKAKIEVELESKIIQVIPKNKTED